MTIRTRQYFGGSKHGTFTHSSRLVTSSYIGNNLQGTSWTATGPFIGLQRTDSSGHKFPPSKSEIKKYLADTGHLPDLGGNFLTQKVWVDPGGFYVDVKSIGYREPGPLEPWHRSAGMVYPWLTKKICTAADFVAPSPNGLLDSIGTILISRCLPTNPHADIGQFLGELMKDGVPTLPNVLKWASKASSFRSLSRGASKEYLNVQFGWAPFIKDITDFCTTVSSWSKKVEQFTRDSGRDVRRSAKFPTELTTAVTNLGSIYGTPGVSGDCAVSPGVCLRTVTTTVERWFKGTFCYYLPPTDKTVAGKLKRYESIANKMLGARITPSLLYKLAPWSWAADWFSSLGHVIKNMSAFQKDGLVMRYGYVMERKTSVTQYSLYGVTLKGGISPNSTQSVIAETLVRRRATPYGFGLNPQSFTGFQWSIIAALGISKAPRSLAF